jgi:quercetin dioxygenase-like cupin family protein
VIGQPVAFSLEDAAQYPLFTPEALALMEEVLPPQDRAQVATAHLVHARRPEDRHGVSDRRDAERSAPAPSGVVAIGDVPAAEVEAPGVVVRKLAGVEDADLKVLEVAPDGSTPHHVHLHAHEGVVIAGRGHLRLDRGPQPLRPGDAFRVNPNDRHAIVNDGTEPLRLVCMDCLLE